MQFHNNPGMGIAAGAALVQYRLIKPDGNYCGLDANKDWIGVTMEARASGKTVPVRFTKAGTIPCTGSEAITIGDIVYKAANGKVSKTAAGSIRVGVALETTTADGDFLEVMPD